MPVPFTAAQMKAWLETGDFPTQQQLADIIDTMVHQNQQALDIAQAAQDLMADLVARVGTIYGAVLLTNTGSVAATEIHLHGCTIGLSGGGVGAASVLTVTFDDVQPSDEYVCTFSCEKFSPYVANAQEILITRNAGSVVFTIPASAVLAQSWEFHFAIFLPEA
jgi:hypothetical protein